MTSFLEAFQRYDGSNRDTRSRLWDLCVAGYHETDRTKPHHKTVRQLSGIIGFSIDREDTVGDWCKVGYLIEYCGKATYTDEKKNEWTLRVLWGNCDMLSYDHLLRVAKLAKKHELDPAEIVERLYNAMAGTQGKPQTAESLERDIEEAHEPQAELLRRDWKRINARVTQNIDSLVLRGVSETARQKWLELCELIESEVQGIEQALFGEPPA